MHPASRSSSRRRGKPRVKDYQSKVSWSDEDWAYVADIPDIEFCSAVGATPEEAVRGLAIARDIWIEVAHEAGKPIPPPRYRPAIYAATCG